MRIGQVTAEGSRQCRARWFISCARAKSTSSAVQQSCDSSRRSAAGSRCILRQPNPSEPPNCSKARKTTNLSAWYQSPSRNRISISVPGAPTHTRAPLPLLPPPQGGAAPPPEPKVRRSISLRCAGQPRRLANSWPVVNWASLHAAPDGPGAALFIYVGWRNWQTQHRCWTCAQTDRGARPLQVRLLPRHFGPDAACRVYLHRPHARWPAPFPRSGGRGGYHSSHFHCLPGQFDWLRPLRGTICRMDERGDRDREPGAARIMDGGT